jgi:hypothetical protein
MGGKTRVVVAALVLAGCGGSVALGNETEEVEIPLGEPYVGLVAAIDGLQSSCELGISLFANGATVATEEASIPAGGREWLGFELDPQVTYTTEARWSDCTVLVGKESGAEVSTGFSGVGGDFFTWVFDGSSMVFDTLKQGDDFRGGRAYAEFSDGGEAAAVASDEGLGVRLSDGDLYQFDWTDDRAVGDVLAVLSTAESYVQGYPEWTDGKKPAWW